MYAPERHQQIVDTARARGRVDVERGLIRAAQRTVLLADHSTFGRDDLARVVPLSAVDTLITDVGSDIELGQSIEAGPRLVVV